MRAAPSPGSSSNHCCAAQGTRMHVLYRHRVCSRSTRASFNNQPACQGFPSKAFHVYLPFRSAGGVVVTGLLADPDRVLWFAAEIPRDFVCSYLIWSPCCDLEGWEARWLASWLLLWFGTWVRLARGGTHVKRRNADAAGSARRPACSASEGSTPPLAHVLLGHVMSNPLPFPPGNGHCASVPSFPALCCGQVTVARQPWSGGDTSAHNVSLSLRRSSIS